MSVERRVSPATWLLLGAVASYTGNTSPAHPNVSGSYITSEHQGGATLAFGVRHFLTEPGAVVGVSLHAAAGVGVASISEDQSNSDGTSVTRVDHASATAWSVGAFGGLALDRQLIDQLTLRLAVQLLSVGYQKTTTAPSDTVFGAGSSVNASLIFSPDLELRFAF